MPTKKIKKNLQCHLGLKTVLKIRTIHIVNLIIFEGIAKLGSFSHVIVIIHMTNISQFKGPFYR